MSALASTIAQLLAPLRCKARDELVLQDLIAEMLAREEIPFEREVRLSAHDRIDFLCESIGVEVKVDGSLAEVTRQLHRYAQSDRVSELLLVTTRSRHKPMPPAFAGKPIRVLHLVGGAF